MGLQGSGYDINLQPHRLPCLVNLNCWWSVKLSINQI